MQHAWSRRTIALMASVTLVGGVAVAATRSDGSDGEPDRVGAGPFLDGTTPALAAPTERISLEPAAEATVPAPDTPEAAVDAFFAAEIADDFVTSFALLSEDDRRAAGNAGEWAAAHDELPAFEQFTPEGPARIEGDRAVVAGPVRMAPIVDETVGIFTERADATIVVVAEGGGWRVSFADSVLRPVLPPDTSAAVAASAWLERRKACDDSPEAYTGTILGDPRIAEALCGSTDRLVASDTGDIDDVPDPVPFLTAFGPDGVSLLRSVTFDGPRALTLVVAPLGEEWVVVGAE